MLLYSPQNLYTLTPGSCRKNYFSRKGEKTKICTVLYSSLTSSRLPGHVSQKIFLTPKIHVLFSIPQKKEDWITEV